MTPEEKKTLEAVKSNPDEFYVRRIADFPESSQEKIKTMRSTDPFKMPNEGFDEYGLRFHTDYLNKIVHNIVFLPLEYMAEYVDIICKSYIDDGNEQFISEVKTSMQERKFSTWNATSIGAVAYIALHCPKEEDRKECIDVLNDLYKWYVNYIVNHATQTDVNIN